MMARRYPMDGNRVRKYLLFFLIASVGFSAYADIASVSYVSSVTETKVDVSSTANQDMAGAYTVSGSLIVPTQPLPSPQ